MSNVYLEHFGVKGMRWGVRKQPETVSTGVSKKTTSSDAALANRITAKAQKLGISSLSNAELLALSQRLQLERQYSSLTALPATKSGMDKVNDVLKVVNTVNNVIKIAQSPVGKAAISLGKTVITRAKK